MRCCVAAGALGLALGLCAAAAQAADRPYLYANTAVAEEDEEQVWAVEHWFSQAGGEKSLTVAPEYAFDPVNSLQLELTRVVNRDAPNGHEIELEYKHLFNRYERDGWGWGVVATLDMEREQGGPWQRRAATLFVPFSVALGEGGGGGSVHLNLGLAKPRGERRLLTGVLAAERQVLPRTTLFGEWARRDEGRLLHGGVRYWIKRERLAVDVAWQRVRGEGVRAGGAVLGIAWYDL